MSAGARVLSCFLFRQVPLLLAGAAFFGVFVKLVRPISIPSRVIELPFLCLCSVFAQFAGAFSAWLDALPLTAVQAVYGFFEERELALAGEFLYRSFTACSCALVRQIFNVYGLQRSASSRVLRAFAAAVRGKALFKIIRPSGVERAVFAFKDVDAGAAMTAGQAAGIWFFSDLSQSCYLVIFFDIPALQPGRKISGAEL